MTVQDTTPQVTFVGTGAQLSFAFTFRADDIAWLSVDFVTNFDVFTINADQDNNPGGTVEYTVAPPLNQELTVIRDTPNVQLLDYNRYDPFDSESHEDALDRLTMQIQDLENFIDQTLTQDFDLLGNVDFSTKVDGSMVYWDDGNQLWEDTAADVRYIGGQFQVDVAALFTGNVTHEANASSITGNFYRWLTPSNVRFADIQAEDAPNRLLITTPNLADVVFQGFSGRILQDAETLAYVSELPVLISDHTLLTNIGVNTHAQIDTHVADGTIHFSEASIDHTAIANIGVNSHGIIDSHIADASIHFTQAGIDHLGILNVGANTHAQIDAAIISFNAHIADVTIHFADAPADGNDYARNNNGWNQVFSGVTDHLALTSIGVNTHAAIDTHIALATIHFADAPADATSYVRNNNLWVPETPGGVTDHGALTGLADDDHPQYYNGTLVWTGNLQLGGFSLEECNEFDNLSGIYNFSTIGPGDPTNPDLVECHVRIRSADFNSYAEIGFDGVFSALDICNEAWTGGIQLRARDSSGVRVGLLAGLPDGTLVTYFDGSIVTQTADPVTQGGLLVDNQLTGTGFERVLTQSDLNFGITGFGIWRYRTATDAFPAAGRLQFNNADPELATQLYVNELNDNSADMTNFLDLLADGDIIYLQVTDTSGENVVVEIGVPVKNADVYTFPITSSNVEGQPFANNASMAFVASIGAGAGGTNDHLLLINIGVNTHAQIDTHIADTTVHFLEASIDHTAIQNIGVNSHAVIDAHLASVANPHAVTLQDAYDASAVPQLLLVATEPLTLRDAVVPIGNLLVLEDNLGVDFFTVSPGTMDYGPATQRFLSTQYTPAGFSTVEFYPDDFTRTSTSLNAAMQWTSTITSAVPGGGGVGNDGAPNFVNWAGEIILTEQGNLFNSQSLFSQSTMITCDGANTGPIYTMINQPQFRTSAAGGSRTGSQQNAVRSQMRIGPNIAGNFTLGSHETYFATVFVDATVGTASITLLNYFAPKAPSLIAGGTIGTLNVMDIPNISGAGITTLRGINSAMNSGTFINHTGSATSFFAGTISMQDAPIAMDSYNAGIQWGESSEMIVRFEDVLTDTPGDVWSWQWAGGEKAYWKYWTGFSYWTMGHDEGEQSAGAGAGIQFAFDRVAYSKTTAADPSDGNWYVIFAGPNLRTPNVAGEYSDVLWTAGGTLDIDGLAMSDVNAFKINSISTLLSGGTIADSSTLFVSAMASANATRVQALRVLGRSRIDGRMNHGSEQPAALTASVNDWQLAANNNQRAYVILTTDSLGPYNVTGIDSSFGFAQIGEVVTIYNASVDTITFTHLDAASLAANRLDMVGAAGVAVGPRESIRFWYDDQGSATWFHIQEQ